MKQAVLKEPKKFEIREIEELDPEKNEVLVKIIYCGICGSDMHAFLGSNPFAKFPAILGHEYVGEITKLGNDVKKYKVGDIVTGEPIRNCGQCMYCKAGLYNHCLNEGKKIGAYGEYTTIREDKVYKIPKNIPLEQAPLIEPVAFAIHTLKLANIENKNKILILGAGTIGQMLSVVAKSQGVDYIAMTDLYEKKLKLAAKHGCDEPIWIDKNRGTDKIKDVLGQDTIDIVFDCVCNESSMDTAIKMVKKRGKIVIVGVAEKKVPTDIGLIMYNELNVIGTRMYNDNDFNDAIDLMRKEEINLSKFISKTYKLDEIQNAFLETIENKDKYLKCLIKV